MWSLDGYDKLKAYGFAIHGCIDAYVKLFSFVSELLPLSRYSRKLLWLQVSTANNDPHVIARYYLNCVRDNGGELGHLPCCIKYQ